MNQINVLLKMSECHLLCATHRGYLLHSTTANQYYISAASVFHIHDMSLVHIPYSGKFSLGANFRNFRGQTCFRKNKNRKNGNWWRHYVRTSIWLCEWDGSLQSICPLNGHCKEKEACYYTKHQWIRKRHSEVVEIEISSAESNMPVSHSLLQSWFFRYCESLHTKGRLGRCCTGLFLCFVIQCSLVHIWGVARVSRIREIETAKISSEESGCFFGKICTSENFPLYGTWC